MSTEKTPETLEEANEMLEQERKAKEEAEQKAADSEQRAIGAEKVIENHKKKEKKEPENEPTPDKQLSDADINKVLDEREFFKANPDLVEYKDKLAEYTSKGNSLEDAKVLLEKNDPTIANRNNASKSDFADGSQGTPGKTITQAELSKLPQEEFERVIKMKKKGEIRVV